MLWNHGLLLLVKYMYKVNLCPISVLYIMCMCIRNICLNMLGKYIPNVYTMEVNIGISPF